MPAPTRKALIDNVDSSVQEIFGRKLSAKAAECAKPCLELLTRYLADRECLTKDALKAFKKCLEEASLVTTALPDGASLRDCLEILKEFLMMASCIDGPDKTPAESKYQFIKEANVTKSRSEEDITGAIQRMSDVAKTEVDVPALVSLYGELVARSEESFHEIRKSFVEKLEAATVDVKIPPEVDSIASVDGITQDFLAKCFDMKVSVAVSEKTVSMTSLLRDIKLACSYMGTSVSEFIDITAYEINNREGLAYL